MPTPDDATLALAAAQDGDPRAFERFVRLTRPDVTRYCRYLGNREHHEDDVQETYLQALRSLGTWRHDADATRWLLTIARRVCARSLDRNERARRPELTRRRHADPTDAVALELLLDDLGHDQRQAFVLTQVLGYDYEQAAAICGCPIGTIRSRVARARSQLAAAVRSACAG
jgi:RNA polymerase sigma-70 factor (ECF subfamily)